MGNVTCPRVCNCHSWRATIICAGEESVSWGTAHWVLGEHSSKPRNNRGEGEGGKVRNKHQFYRIVTGNVRGTGSSHNTESPGRRLTGKRNHQNVQKDRLRFGRRAGKIRDSIREFGEQPQGKVIAWPSQKQAVSLGKEFKKTSPDGRQGADTYCAFLTASAVELGEAPSLSGAQTVPGDHETAGSDVQVPIPQLSWGRREQQAAPDWLGWGR